MKIVFLGPSLPDLGTEQGGKTYPSLRIAPPARQGDVLSAVLAGATHIGLVDGAFEQVAAVWHKEILFALSREVTVYGAASMGALRAAECEAFGMRVVGTIARDYADGRRLDDADVAQLHGPAELGYPSLTEPLVNVEAVLDEARAQDLINAADFTSLSVAARTLFFKDRTWKAIFERADRPLDLPIRLEMQTIARSLNLKRKDALELVHLMEAAPSPSAEAKSRTWALEETSQLKTQIEKLCYSRQHNQ